MMINLMYFMDSLPNYFKKLTAVLTGAVRRPGCPGKPDPCNIIPTRNADFPTLAATDVFNLWFPADTEII